MAGGRVPAWRSEHPAIRWGAYAWAFVGMALAFVIVWNGLGYLRIVAVVGTLGYLVTVSVQTELDDLTEQARQTYREVASPIDRLPFIPPPTSCSGK